MFFVTLKFSTRRDHAGDYLEAHQHWVKNGFDDGVFMLAGSLQPGLGGAILAHNLDRAELEHRLDEDPFVREDVVQAEIFEIEPALSDPRLNFLREPRGLSGVAE